MKKFAQAGIAFAFLALAACNNTPAEQAAENVEDAGEHQSDILEEQADNATNEVVEDSLENQADAVEKKADDTADAIENGSVPVANSSTNGM